MLFPPYSCLSVKGQLGPFSCRFKHVMKPMSHNQLSPAVKVLHLSTEGKEMHSILNITKDQFEYTIIMNERKPFPKETIYFLVIIYYLNMKGFHHH